mmetsp:Transcript_1710/g.4825  ORF Transcript_1710/g.4825 Transcript_1710/m.4825 type:complete len:294 (-) Transcript_1710:346-1227(-)
MRAGAESASDEDLARLSRDHDAMPPPYARMLDAPSPPPPLLADFPLTAAALGYEAYDGPDFSEDDDVSDDGRVFEKPPGRFGRPSESDGWSEDEAAVRDAIAPRLGEAARRLLEGDDLLFLRLVRGFAMLEDRADATLPIGATWKFQGRPSGRRPPIIEKRKAHWIAWTRSERNSVERGVKSWERGDTRVRRAHRSRRSASSARATPRRPRRRWAAASRRPTSTRPSGRPGCAEETRGATWWSWSGWDASTSTASSRCPSTRFYDCEWTRSTRSSAGPRGRGRAGLECTSASF